MKNKEYQSIIKMIEYINRDEREGRLGVVFFCAYVSNIKEYVNKRLT